MKRRYLIAWLERCHGNMAAMAKEQGISRQRTHQMVTKEGLNELARELKEKRQEQLEPMMRERERARDRRKQQRKYKRDWRKRYWRKKKREQARKEEWARKKKEAIAVIKSTRGGLEEIRHALGIGRHTIIRWLHLMGLWGLVDEVRAASKAERRL